MNRKPIGLTKDTGWQAGARRTFPLSLDALWTLVVSAQGQGWLGWPAEPLLSGSPGVTTFVEGSHYRRYREGSKAVFQLRVLQAATGATLALMAQNLTSENERYLTLEQFEQSLALFEGFRK
jgi:hypothetical protein